MDNNVFLERFENAAQDKGNMFLPDNLDDRYLKNIIIFVKDKGGTEETLNRCAARYLRDNQLCSLKDFASKIIDILKDVRSEEESRDNFSKILEDTKKRMEQ